MKERFIVISEPDMARLSRLAKGMAYSLLRDQQQLQMLEQTLETAEVRPPARVPEAVVRMNSCARVLDSDTGERELYTLVFPEEANFSRGLISVLAPVGIALLGRRQGETVEAKVPGGVRKLRIELVRYAPNTGSKIDVEDRRPASAGRVFDESEGALAG